MNFQSRSIEPWKQERLVSDKYDRLAGYQEQHRTSRDLMPVQEVATTLARWEEPDK